MKKLTFKINELDCSEEVAILKKALVPVVGREEFLDFDLLENRLTIEFNPETGMTGEQIVGIISGTGLKAVLLENGKTGNEKFENPEMPWICNKRNLYFSISALFFITGFTVHYFSTDLLQAFTGSFNKVPGQTEYIIRSFYVLSALVGGRYIYPKAWFSLKNLRPDMNLLMTIAVTGAFIIGEWFEAAFVVMLFSLALLLESWSIQKARNAIKTLIGLKPLTAKVKNIETGEIDELPVEEIETGSILIISPGEKIPLDGKIVNGGSYINQAAITGESIPVHRTTGDEVYAGTLNEEGMIEVKSSKKVDDTTLSRIIELVEKARSKRARSEQWIDRFAAYYTPAMIFLALIIATAPPVLLDGRWLEWFYQALVILVIGCPCALVISTPVSIIAGLTSASRNGIIIKGGIFLETLSRLKAVAFDKTGTLTYGRPAVREIIAMNDHSEEQILKSASALEIHSSHPVARSIVEYTRNKKIEFTPAEEFKLKMGMGAEGSLNGKRICIGNTRLMKENGLDSTGYYEKIEGMENRGITPLALCEKDHICAIIGISDEVRSNASGTVMELKKSGIGKVVMLTGDNQKTASAVAEATGIDDYQSGLFPEEKAAAVGELQNSSGETAMIGDGINDAPAMASASIGIAMGGIGSDSAIETADITLMSDNIERLPWLINHSRKTLGIIKQNIFFALGLKLLFVILAVGGYASLWMAIAADMGASLLVIFNSLRLLNNGD